MDVPVFHRCTILYYRLKIVCVCKSVHLIGPKSKE